MEIDLNKYLPTFIEESLELIQAMEDILLNLEVNSVDEEKINQMFRSVHTLKSSSAAFDLTSISEFSHTIESFLNPVRHGERKISPSQCELLLKAVDCLRGMIFNVKENQNIDVSCANSLTENFMNFSLEEKPVESLPATEVELTTEKKINHWEIEFKPKSELFQSGNDPLRVFQEIANLGSFKTIVNVTKLPSFSNFEPENCYLSWKMFLASDMSSQKIEEILNWICGPEEYSISSANEPKEKIEVSKPALHKEQEKTVVQEQKATEIAAISSTVRINTDKLDKFINLVGELVITQSMLNQIVKHHALENLEELKEGLTLLAHNCRELQEEAMHIRMLPISTILNRFPRMIHEIAKQLGKQANLIVSGEQTELDRSVIEKIIDPLGHLLRNTIDHGIEMPEVRIAAGKPASGTIWIDTYQTGGSIIITVKDDGAGFNVDAIREKAINSGIITENEELTPEKISWIIVQPGFSTASHITEISGRGVGMDVVNKNIQQLGGRLEMTSVPGAGATFSLRLPLTLLIMDCQLIQIHEQTYAIPLISMMEILKIETEHVSYVDNQTSLYYLRTAYIPIISLASTLGISSQKEDVTDKFLLVVTINNQLYGLICDNVSSQQQIVIKNLEDNFHKIPGISGATILGDGSVALIIDVNGVVDLFLHRQIVSPKIETNVQEISSEDKILEKDQTYQLISFSIAGMEYALDILNVHEIHMNEKITRLPNVPKYIMGAMNLRGIIIPIIDFAQLFNLGKLAQSPNKTILVISVLKGKQRKVVGIVVDAVSDTYQISANEIQELPEHYPMQMEDFIRGIIKEKNKPMIILNIDKFFPFFEE